MKNSKNNIKKDKAEIENSLHRYFLRLKGPAIIIQAMKYAVFNGGKRLRPILLLEVAKVFRKDKKNALPMASAVELIHGFSLVHDDLPSMDNDDYRRGKASCHKRFGEGIALLAGDGLLNMAFGIIAKEKYGKEAVGMLSDAIGTSGMIGGQALDLKATGKKRISKVLKRRIDRMKTASLIAVSCGLGALSAGAGKNTIKKAEALGKDLGIAFQIADDLRDTERKGSEASKMKKYAEEAIAKCRKTLKTFSKKSENLQHIIGIVQKRIYG